MGVKIGERLNREWKVGARHALYRQNGGWFHHLTRFPGALFDENGYIVFDTEEEYRQCPQLRHGIELNVTGGIANIPGYIRKRP